MTIQNVSPIPPPIPQTFKIGLTPAEAKPLIAALEDQFAAVFAESSGNLTFCNIRFNTAPNQTDPTAAVDIQFTAIAAKRVQPTPAVPVASPPPSATPAPATATPITPPSPK